MCKAWLFVKGQRKHVLPLSAAAGLPQKLCFWPGSSMQPAAFQLSHTWLGCILVRAWRVVQQSQEAASRK